MKRIAILAGGYSSESEISELSAEVVKKHLSSETYHCQLVYVYADKWETEMEGKRIPINRHDFSYTLAGQTYTFDAAFNAIHGAPGENGSLPAYLEMLGIPYTGPKPLQAALTFNKWFCNTFLLSAGIPCAASFLIRKGQIIDTASVLKTTGLPCFVKPNNGGSSFGVTKVKEESALKPAIDLAMQHDHEVIIESFLQGREVTCGVYALKGQVKALPITEIVSKNEFFDYNAKYKGDSEEITPAPLDEALTKQIQETTVRVFSLLGLSSFARIDYIIVEGKPFLLEVNTVPGLSEASIVPQQVRAAGMELRSFFTSLLEEVL